jgi:plastocyanin
VRGRAFAGIARHGRILGGALFLAAACAATGSASLGNALAAEAPRTHQVVIQGLQYLPQSLAVRRGDSVVWTNKDPFPHTVTAAGAFDSRSIEAGKSWRFVARAAGTYPYVCTLHSNMKGQLQVE